MNRDTRGPAEAQVPPSSPGIPLPLAAAGQEVVLVNIQGGIQMRHRMAEMGLTPGVRFRVVAASRGGPVVIQVKGSRLMIGRGMLHRVVVAPIPRK